MKPEEVTAHGATLLAAIREDAEQLAAETAVSILIGVAHNLAKIAHLITEGPTE